MLTYIPSAAAKEALSHLVRLDSISHLVDVWSREIEDHVEWTSARKQECSVHVFSAMRVSLRNLADEKLREYITIEEFHDLLHQVSGSMWHEALSCIKAVEMPLQDVALLFLSLREITFKSLQDAQLLGIDEMRVLVFFFDWVLAQVYEIWASEHDYYKSSLAARSLDVDDLRAIVESVRSPVDLNPVLQVIVDRVRESGMWPMCAIGIIDPEDQEIRVPAQSGFSESYPANIRFPAGGSATLETIHRKKPIAISDVYADHEFPILPEAAKAAGYRSILLVPLFTAEMRAVVAFCSGKPHQYKDDEIALANAIAQQVMIAIENAYQYQHEKRRVDELESLNRFIAEQNRLLQQATKTHTALTRLVLDDAGLDRILEAVREILGNPVVIEDQHFQLLNFSEDQEYFDQHRIDSISAGGTVPELFSNPETAAILERLRKHRRALLMPTLPEVGIEKRRIVAPIIAGAEILGYVWVMEALRPFNDQQDLITAEQAALVIALEMMKQRASYETELRLRSDFLGDLFSESSMNESDLLRRARFLGFNFGQPTLLLVVDIDQDTGKDQDLLEVQAYNRQIIARVQAAVTSLCQENLVANQAGRILVIVPAMINGIEPSRTASKLASTIRNEIKQLSTKMNVCIGVGDVFQNISAVRRSSLQATRALDAAKSLGRVDETLGLSDLGIYGILFREGETNELLRFAENSLAPLIEYDRQNGTQLLNTLDVYLYHQARLAETARKLYIHVNTLRQRLERIENVLDVSLEDRFVTLNLQLALRVYEVTPESHLSK